MRPSVLVVAPVVLLTALAVAAPVTAQGLEEPLVARAEEKAAAATNDPQAFVADQATEEALADDANWTIAYGCFLKHEAEEAGGADLPEADRCAGYEEALGIAEEAAEEQEEEVVADAQALNDDAVAEAEALAEDALDTTAGVLDDPQGAADALAAFVGRLVAALGRVVDGILGGVGDAGTLLGDALVILARGCAIAVAAPFVGAAKLAGLLWSGGTAVATGVAGFVVGAATTVVDAVRAGAAGVAEGGAAAWDTVADAATQVRDVVTGLFESGPSGGVQADDALPNAPGRRLGDTTDRIDGILDVLEP